MAPKTKPSGRKPTLRQRKLIEQIPEIVKGKKTAKKAIIDSGYTETNADKNAKEILGSAGVRDELAKAMKVAGVTIQKVAKKINEGLEATRKFAVHDGDDVTYEHDDDYATRHKYVVTALELHDAFPAKKNLHGIVDPEELLNDSEKEAVVAPWGDSAEDAA